MGRKPINRLLPVFLVLHFLLNLPAQASSIDSSIKLTLERNLYRLGIPTGKIDGIFDGQTQRAMCIWRELTGRGKSRALPSGTDYIDIADTGYLFPTSQQHLGLNINLTCQSAYWVREDENAPITIFKASTGRAEFPTDPGDYLVRWTIDGWYESRQFPDGWMYRPMFFNSGQALHGSESDTMVHSYPASHGCVRMAQKDMDYLWDQGFGKGSIVHVYGRWKFKST